MDINWWNKVKLIGVRDNTSPDMQRQVVLTNQLAIVGFVTMFIGAIIDFSIGVDLLAATVALCAPFQLLPLLFNKFQKYNTASFTLVMMVNSVLFYFYPGRYCRRGIGICLWKRESFKTRVDVAATLNLPADDVLYFDQINQ